MHKLEKAIMQQGKEGWNILEALNFIMNSDDFGYTSQDKELAEIVYSAIEGRKALRDENFRIHSKGLGVV
jgi:bifunctional pyridoxal-dependent enzyme with beta-cystathionase and maltose regulon repressor activities